MSDAETTQVFKVIHNHRKGSVFVQEDGRLPSASEPLKNQGKSRESPFDKGIQPPTAKRQKIEHH